MLDGFPLHPFTLAKRPPSWMSQEVSKTLVSRLSRLRSCRPVHRQAHVNRILKGPGVVVPLVFPKVPHNIYPNYSDLTQPHAKWQCSRGTPQQLALFQGNLGWWNIVIWPDNMLKHSAKAVIIDAIPKRSDLRKSQDCIDNKPSVERGSIDEGSCWAYFGTS